MPFPVTYASGMLVFDDYDDYTLPNQAVMVVDWGFSQLWTPTITHENRESTEAEIPYPGVQKGKTAIIPLVITGDWNVSGAPYTNHTQGLMENVAELNAMVASTLTGDGTQTVTFTAYPSATPVSGEVQLMPVDLGNSAKIGGSRAVMELRLPNGPLA